MTAVTREGWAVIEAGSVVIANQLLRIRGLKFVREVGRGANAVVFEAIDQALDRRVAVKVWNARGMKRAQFEAAKIARFNHPLIVTTHRFGRARGYPYCVMELVAGSSGKGWLREKPSVEQRVAVWRLYSKVLRFIHDAGSIHGDPHLGNVLVFPDSGDVFGNSMAGTGSALSIKIADTGTSRFWSSRDDIVRRESELMIETARRLFEHQNLDALWVQPPDLSHQDTLRVLDGLCDYVWRVYGSTDSDCADGNAAILVDLLLKTPLFELDEVIAQVKRTGYIAAGLLIYELNLRLGAQIGFLDYSEVLKEDAMRWYRYARAEFVGRLRASRR